MIVERVVRVEAPVASPTRAVIEVVLLERRPGRLRAWVAKLLVRIAGRIAGLRVRVMPDDGR